MAETVSKRKLWSVRFIDARCVPFNDVANEWAILRSVPLETST